VSDETKSESAGAPDGQAAAGADEPAPPRMYRPMKADGAFPMTGASATTLGARTPKDVPVDAQGRVRPETGGMSVRPRIADIPAAFLPRRLKHLNRNAGGSESVVVFRYGDVNASFAAAPVAPALFLRPDAPGHGNVEPRAEMEYDAYQTALHATREGWVNGEND
jgi:hypothetical protein